MAWRHLDSRYYFLSPDKCRLLESLVWNQQSGTGSGSLKPEFGLNDAQDLHQKILSEV